MSSVAVPTKNHSLRSSRPEQERVAREVLAPKPPQPVPLLPDRDLVREKAAELYGQGYKRSQVARILADHIAPNSRADRRNRAARIALKRWEQHQDFRDMIYQRAVVAVEIATPDILQGVVARAIDGRVDAARLALEVTGRHNPKGEQAPTQVVVAFGNVPRPGLLQTTEADEIDGEVVED